jgi:hypothetical protein
VQLILARLAPARITDPQRYLRKESITTPFKGGYCGLTPLSCTDQGVVIRVL